MSEERRLKRIGAIWKPKPGSKSLGSGKVTVDGMKQGFVILRNDRKQADSKDPDYLMYSSEPAVADDYGKGRRPREPQPHDDDEPIPF